MPRRGACIIQRQDLEFIETPTATDTWFHLAHRDVLGGTISTLESAGFEPARTTLALSQDNDNARFFGTIDLRCPVSTGISLAVDVCNNQTAFPERRSVPSGRSLSPKTALSYHLAGYIS